MKALVLGASGMLGNAVMRVLEQGAEFQVYGTVRSENAKRLLPAGMAPRLITGVDVEQADALISVLRQVRPDVVVNCIGLVKQLADADDPLKAIPINSLLPHRLARLCDVAGARLVHMSTDCVFSGQKGMYLESDASDAQDLYGRTKYLGEVDYPNAITLRTSIIGHELAGAQGLINWFLSQRGEVKGFRCAIFSGLTTVELAHVIRDQVLPRPDLRGVYHVSADPINKFDLLSLVAQVYQKYIRITPDDVLVIDRSLDSTRFRQATGYTPPAWKALLEKMHEFY
ncbi:MAG: SDR family oxidoreductase [Pseudomonadota bacterium]